MRFNKNITVSLFLSMMVIAVAGCGSQQKANSTISNSSVQQEPSNLERAKVYALFYITPSNGYPSMTPEEKEKSEIRCQVDTEPYPRLPNSVFFCAKLVPGEHFAESSRTVILHVEKNGEVTVMN